MGLKELIKEDTQLLNDMLERNYYDNFRSQTPDFNGPRKAIELILLGSCKSNCEYCYWKQYHKDLYPVQLMDNDKIIENLQIFLNWYIKNDFKCQLEIFSGQWLDQPIANRVFETFYNTYKDQPECVWRPTIVCPDNMQFLKNKQATLDLEKNISKLKSIGINFGMSCSIDGLYCEYGRTANDESFYETLRDFVNKYHCGLHPMISSHNVKDWIKNYQWFKEFFGKENSDYMTMLEVRDGTWDDESIEDLIRFCDFLIDDKFKDFNYDKKTMLQYIMHEGNIGDCTYNPISFLFQGIPNGVDSPSCTFIKNLMIRLGDLSIVPCHRQSYEELIYGKYEVLDGEITKANPKNVTLMAANTHLKRSCLPKCSSCKVAEICTGFCHGASYEDYRNPYIPQRAVCKMYQTKIYFLLYKYSIMGIFDLFNTDEEFKKYKGPQMNWVFDMIKEARAIYE